MFGSIGMPELVIILVIALIIFGPRKLPELGKSLGKSINEFKKASNDLRSTLDDEIRQEERRAPAPTAAPAVTPSPAIGPHEYPALPAPAAPEGLSGHEAASETIARGQHGS